MSTFHPGAALFSEAAREAVAAGPLFDQGHFPTENYTRQGDYCCVVGALLYAQWVDLEEDEDYHMPDTVDVRRVFRDYEGVALTEEQLRDIDRLTGRNDRGLYADRAALRRDLLGIEEGGAE